MAIMAVGVHASLGLLDILAVFMFGLVGSLAVSGVASNQPGSRISSLLTLLRLSDNTLQFQVATIGVLASFILICKSLVSLYLSKKTLFFFSRRSALISKLLVTRLLGQDIVRVRKRSVQETIFALTAGVQSITVGILGSAVLLASDLFLISAFSISLFVVDTLVALCSLFLFSSIGFLLYSYMHRKAQSLGEVATTLNIKSNNKIAEVVACYRELLVKDRRNYYAKEIGTMRLGIAEAGANLGVMSLLSKYMMEITMVVGALLIGAVQFAIQPATRAVAVISIFLIASARMAPAVLRIQTGLINIRNNVGAAKPTLDLVEEYLSEENYDRDHDLSPDSFIESRHPGFEPRVTASSVSFRYPSRGDFVLSNLTLNVKPGEFIGIVGPSGSGKTTLVDLLLGILTPEQGEVTISGIRPSDTFKKWPGAVAYVPQEVSIVGGSVKENVCLGYDSMNVEDSVIESLLRTVKLDDLIDLPKGVHTLVGDGGNSLSGGQRQRLGIARALFTNPKLLILDEATSALDSVTEREVTTHLSALKGQLTMIVIAHRLSTIKESDRIVYLKNGKVLGIGQFEKLRKELQELDDQARLMGL